ncbi:HAD-IA family hydrolase, partial [Pseudomonas coronafaciens]|uniref:HAD-IA family hydrolase n=1 Tax=Pseudomonas coronafaciens TaxID=53409 RepID=UPI000F00696D
PEIYTKAIKQLGMKPEECLIVEDNENGIKAARASGAHVLVVAQTCDANLNNILDRVEQINADKVASL